MKESGQAGETLLRYRSVVGFYMMSVCMSACTCRAPEDKKVRGTLSWGDSQGCKCVYFEQKCFFFYAKL